MEKEKAIIVSLSMSGGSVRLISRKSRPPIDRVEQVSESMLEIVYVTGECERANRLNPRSQDYMIQTLPDELLRGAQSPIKSFLIS